MKWFVREKMENIGSHEVGLILDFCGYSATVPQQQDGQKAEQTIIWGDTSHESLKKDVVITNTLNSKDVLLLTNWNADGHFLMTL